MLRVKQFKRFGSYTRNTILPRKYDERSDVDLMVVFDTSVSVYTPETYRKYILEAVQSAYPNSVSKKDFPVVKLELNHIMFDLVPAIIEHYPYIFTNDKDYKIPGRNNSWIKTDPDSIKKELSSLNSANSGNLVRDVVRLMKHWNAASGYPFQSYLLEKEILKKINVFSFSPITVYEEFLNVLDRTAGNRAGNRAGVSQAIQYIRHYRGDMWRVGDEEKEWQWVKKLLPGLNNTNL